MEPLEKERPHSREDQKPKQKLHLVSAQRFEQQEHEPVNAEHERRRLIEELERERRGYLEAQQRIERLEEENEKLLNVQQGLERLSQELQQSIRILENERPKQQDIQQQAKRLEQQRLRLQQEQQQLRIEVDGLKQLPAEDPVGLPAAYRPLWRRPIPVAVRLVTMLVMWLISLVVASNLLHP